MITPDQIVVNDAIGSNFNYIVVYVNDEQPLFKMDNSNEFINVSQGIISKAIKMQIQYDDAIDVEQSKAEINNNNIFAKIFCCCYKPSINNKPDINTHISNQFKNIKNITRVD